jgi:hypothetical protein
MPKAPGVEDLPCGVILSEAPEEAYGEPFPRSIKPGMLLSAMDGVDLRAETFTSVMRRLKTMRRPLTLTFESTPEHEALDRMVRLFLEADQDRSGALSPAEVATVIHTMYTAGRFYV